MKLNSPWLYGKDELRSALLFHGSAEPWRTTTPRGGGYDGVFWTTEDPLTAQTYIPDWGWKVIIGFSRWNLDERIRPDRNCSLWEIAKTLGADADVHEYDLDRATCWLEKGKPITYRQVADRLAELGYQTDEGDYHFRLKKEGSEILPSDRTPLGRLIIIEPGAESKTFDMAAGSEPDLTDLQYHKVKSFGEAFAAGFDAVIINDFAQSPKMGNIGHKAIGLSPDAAARLHKEGRIIAIPATHRDFTWPMGKYPDNFSTPDFDHWHFTEVCRAIARGEPVAASVIREHEERLNALRNQSPDKALSIPCGIDSLEIPGDWLPAGSDDAKTDALHERIRKAEAIEISPPHRDALGRLLLDTLDPDFGLALRRAGVATCVAFTLDDGHGSPVLVSEFLALAVDRLIEPHDYLAAPGGAV